MKSGSESAADRCERSAQLDNDAFVSFEVVNMSNRTGLTRTDALGSTRSDARADEVVGSSSYKCDEV